MRYVHILNTMLIVVLAYVLGAFASPVAAAGVIVSIDCPAAVHPGEDFTARVKIADVSGFDAAQYDITYDPAVIQVKNVNISGGLIGGTAIPVTSWGFIPAGTQGRLRVINNVPGTPGVTGSGYLVELVFNVVGSSGNSTITLKNGFLSDNTAKAISATWVNGMVQVTASSSPPAGGATTDGGGGGGGGSGGGGGGAVSGEKRITSLTNITSASFKILEDMEALSVDTRAKIFIKMGTILLNKQGSMVSSIVIEKLVNPPEASINREIIGGVYDIGPNGAQFEPWALLSLEYDEKSIPEGIPESNLYVATWNEANHEWERMESTVDPDNNKITADLNHLSIYAIMAGTRPASFVVADLAPSPAEVSPGGSLKISALVTNIGDLTGSYKVSLKIDGTAVQTKDVKLDGSDSQTVNFSLTPDNEGEHTIVVGNLVGKYVVKEAKAPPPPPVPPAPTLAVLPPSMFTVSDLSVTPDEARPGEVVTISAVVTNTGGSEGIYTVVLRINDTEEARKEVTLQAGESKTVDFTIAKDTLRTYIVNVNDKAGQLRVALLPPLPKSTGALLFQPSTNWALIAGTAVVSSTAIAGIVYGVMRRRRNV